MNSRITAGTWWSRNWLWVAPAGCITTIVATVAFGAAILPESVFDWP